MKKNYLLSTSPQYQSNKVCCLLEYSILFLVNLRFCLMMQKNDDDDDDAGSYDDVDHESHSLSLFEGNFVLPASDDRIVNLRFNDGCKINFSSYFHIFQHGEKRK